MNNRLLLTIFALATAGLRADTFDFSGLGPENTVVTNPVSITSTGGVVGNFSQVANSFQRRDQSSGWSGAFLNGTPLLWTSGANGPVTLSFSSLVSNFSIGVQQNAGGTYTANLLVYNNANALIGNVSVSAFSSFTGSGSNAVLSFAGTGIKSVQFSLSSGPQNFAFSAPTFTAATGVPEPSSAFILMAGLAASATWIRRRRHQ